MKFITNALAPAKIISVVTKEKEKEATVEVEEDQMSLAIGKAGQNVRLAAKLTGWKIDVVKAAPVEGEKKEEAEVKSEDAEKAPEAVEASSAKEADAEVAAIFYGIPFLPQWLQLRTQLLLRFVLKNSKPVTKKCSRLLKPFLMVHVRI